MASRLKDSTKFITSNDKIASWNIIKCFRYKKEHPYTTFFKYNYDQKSREVKLLERRAKDIENR